MAVDQVWIRLSCDHRAKPRPIPDLHDRWWCEECDDVRTVIEIREFRYYCQTCHAGGLYGGALILAQQGATRHVRKNPTHRTEIFCGETPVMIVAGSRVGNSRDLPLF